MNGLKSFAIEIVEAKEEDGHRNGLLIALRDQPACIRIHQLTDGTLDIVIPDGDVLVNDVDGTGHRHIRVKATEE